MNWLWLFLGLLAIHWIADFILQTHWQATNKSKNNIALLHHVATYTTVLAVVSIVFFGFVGILYALVNGLLHFATDFNTSRWTARLYAKQDWHNFFVVIGFDQLLHQTTLLVTMYLFFVRT